VPASIALKDVFEQAHQGNWRTGNDPDPPAATTQTADTLALAVGRAWSGFANAGTINDGFTIGFSGAPSGQTGFATCIGYKQVAAANTTVDPLITNTSSGSSSFDASLVIIATEPRPTSSVLPVGNSHTFGTNKCARPHVKPGQCLVATAHGFNASGFVAQLQAPAGWTQVQLMPAWISFQGDPDAEWDVAGQWYRIADSSDETTTEWTWTGIDNTEVRLTIASYANVDSSAPLGATPTNDSRNSENATNTAVAPTTTVARNGSRSIVAIAPYSVAPAVPAGYSPRSESLTQIRTFDKAVNAGPTGSISSALGAAQPWGAMQMVLQPIDNSVPGRLLQQPMARGVSLRSADPAALMWGRGLLVPGSPAATATAIEGFGHAIGGGFGLAVGAPDGFAFGASFGSSFGAALSAAQALGGGNSAGAGIGAASSAPQAQSAGTALGLSSAGGLAAPLALGVGTATASACAAGVSVAECRASGTAVGAACAAGVGVGDVLGAGFGRAVGVALARGVAASVSACTGSAYGWGLGFIDQTQQVGGLTAESAVLGDVLAESAVLGDVEASSVVL
jgi:hypothetical protein